MLRNGALTFGAYLLFADEYTTISEIQIGRFKTPTHIIDSFSTRKDLFTEVEEIMLFIRKHLKVEYIFTGNPQREERYDYPIDALREIVLNMIVHRDYRKSSDSVIKIFDDKIEFFNPGNLYGEYSVADLLSGNYKYRARNKMVAYAFKEIG